MAAIYHKFRQIFIGVCSLVVILTVLRTFVVVHISSSSPSIRFSELNQTSPKIACQRPILEIDNPKLKSFFRLPPPLQCGNLEGEEEVEWVFVQNGSVILRESVTSRYSRVICNYTFFDRQNDDENKHVQNVIMDSSDKIKTVHLLSDYFHVHCFDSANAKQNFYRNIMPGIQLNNKSSVVGSPPVANAVELNLNVLIFGLDSLSRLTFMRKLPLTYEYLTKVLEAAVLKGYNIVGDGTPQALIPILTGKTEPELPDTRKRMGETATHVNVYPFIWKDFSSRGYVTAFAEDCPQIGTFTYRLKGFKEQPTDHYLRPFYVELDKFKSENKKYCIGHRPSHKVFTDWVRQFFEAYRNQPKFMFAFHGELSHDDINLVGVADEDLRDFFKSLKENGHLENTVLIVMSDHGHRFAAFRETQQGKMEERLPFFSFAFPSWFKTRYPKAWANLLNNTERLTTPFDIHATLNSILNNADVNNSATTSHRSISLLSEVPLSRTCKDAGVDAHWCSCLSWEQVSKSDKIVEKATQHLITYMNNLTKPYVSLCDSLQLDSLISAEKYVPQSELLHYKKNSDFDGFEGDFSDNTAVSQVVYELKVSTAPGGGHFEATIVHHVDSDIFIVNEKEISRVNSYGTTSSCIMDIQPDLRKYCHCRN